MLVSYVRGDFYYGFSSGSWELNETKECEIASRTSRPLDDRKDVLLCGMDTRTAWKLSWIRSDLRTVVYEHARRFAVTFHSAGESRGRRRRSGSAREHQKASIVSDLATALSIEVNG